MQLDFILLVLVPSVLSIVGGVFTVATYCLFENTRSTAQLFAVFLAVSGMCYGSLSFFHSAINDDSTLCTLTAVAATYFNNTSLFTTIVVARFMYRIFFGMMSHSESAGSMKLSARAVVFIWVIPALLAALPFSTGHYGRNDDDMFCWIEGMNDESNDNHQAKVFSLVWQAVVVGIPVISGISYNVWVYYSILKNIQHLNDSSADQNVRASVMAVINRIRWYPIILGGVYILPFADRIHTVASGNNSRLLTLMGVGSLRFKGFLDSVAYGLTPSIIEVWKSFFVQLCRYSQRSQGQSQFSSNDDRPILDRMRFFKSDTCLSMNSTAFQSEASQHGCDL